MMMKLLLPLVLVTVLSSSTLFVAVVESFSSVHHVVSTTTRRSKCSFLLKATSTAGTNKEISTAGKIPIAGDPSHIRNLAIVGHSHCGKTALAEWMMYDENVLTKRPEKSTGHHQSSSSSTSSSSSVLDSDPTELARHSSVFSHYVRIPHRSNVLELTDTPWGDFPSDASASLSGADSALLLVSAADGVQAGTVSAYAHCTENRLPVLVALSKMDRPYVSAQNVLQDMENAFGGTKPVPLQVPIGEGENFNGVKSLLVVDEQGNVAKNNEMVNDDDELQLAWIQMEEAVAMVDDELLIDYLEDGELEEGRVLAGLRTAVINGKILPVAYTSAEQDAGVTELMDAVVAVLPDPVEVREVALKAACESDQGKCGMEPGVEAGFSARVLHTNVDSFGSLSVLRVITNSKSSSSSSSDSDDAGVFDGLPNEAVVLRTGEKIKMPSSSACFGLIGKERYSLADSAITSQGILPGDVLAVPKLSEAVQTNDILTDPDAVKEDEAEIFIESETHQLTPLSRSAEAVPMMASATVSLLDAADSSNKRGKRGRSNRGGGGDEKILSALRAMSREDLAMKVEHDPSGMLLLRCMSSDHLNVIAQRLKERYGLDVELGRPPVQYRETLSKPVKNVEGKHKKQSGGSGQFGVCVIDMEPLEEGSGVEFVSKIKGGVISKPFVSSVERGIREQLQAGGGPFGFPVTDVKITLVDGKMHSVDSKDIAFQSAGKQAVKAALEKGKTRLLQPLEKVIFRISEQLQGEISAIVARGDGYLVKTDVADDGVHLEVEAVIPTSSIGDVSDILRAASGGEAQYTATFSHYKPVPDDLVERLLGTVEEESKA